jgi:thiol-disulfide isomerase/thioredoxin/outer membrane lipoprotein-sorting protein
MNRSRKSAVLFLAISGLVLSSGSVFAGPATQPSTTQPVALAPAATQPASAAALLNDINSAYANLASARFDGTITGQFDVRGQVQTHDATFSSTFAAPNKFRHETKDDVLVGSTGSTVYSYLGARDQYQSADAPKSRAASADWPSAMMKILNDQNPAMVLALSTSAAAELKAISKNMTLEPPTVIDGISYPTLRFDVGTDHEIVTMLVDPSTHLLRSVSTDYRKPMEKAGAIHVKQALVTVDYATAGSTPVNGNDFAWTPPTGAALVTTVAMEMADDSPDAVKDLVGKPAPDFTLKGLDDKAVKLSDLKGSVVIVDFWATWCGPCVASLPHLDELYKQESPNGLKVFAVNLQEDKQTVQAFVEKKKWSLPVLLDTEGSVAQKYKANAIPETVVIGKDGNVAQVFVGSGHEEEIKALVAKAMK